MSDWGPSHQSDRPTGPGDHKKLIYAVVFIAAVAYPLVLHLLIWAALFYGGARLERRFNIVSRLRGFLAGSPGAHASAPAALPRPAVHLGVDRAGRRRWSRQGRAVLVIGPSQSGKTSSVIVPTLLDYPGPVVSTSTKPDVLRATMSARCDRGQLWQFDPTGHAPDITGVQTLRWSPLSCSAHWDGALLMARAMVDGSGAGVGTTDGTHWTKRAQALLAAILHAAATSDAPMRTVIGWVTSHDIDQPLAALREHAGAPLALDVLSGVANTEERERSSIFSATADALDAYTSQAALDAAAAENFDADRFVTSHDAVYIYAPAESQRMAAPLVCGLLAEIRRATYHAHASGQLDGRRVLFALDEVANVAPITELPQIASEGGGQGLLLLAVLQDLSQARARWGTIADGFLTLFGSKLILPGVADQRTLETISVALGEYDRRVVTESRANVPGLWATQKSTSHSTQRTRVLSPGEVANIPAGRALHLDGVRWELLTLTPVHQAHSPFEAVVHAH
ncbi:MAG: type IV secretory system conjugative DNA transfer family protein [Solirubrobacteraceae bacterium]